MTIGDVIFYSLMSLILVVFFWLKFLEDYIPLWGAYILAGCIMGFIVTRFEKLKPKIYGKTKKE